MKRKASVVRDKLRAEYSFDYSTAERGRHYRRLLREGANVVVLEPDVATAFPDSETVNRVLRLVLRASKAARRSTARGSKRPRARRATG